MDTCRCTCGPLTVKGSTGFLIPSWFFEHAWAWHSHNLSSAPQNYMRAWPIAVFLFPSSPAFLLVKLGLSLAPRQSYQVAPVVALKPNLGR